MVSSYIAWYLFFAGAGSGAYVVGAIVNLFARPHRLWLSHLDQVTKPGLIIGPALVALGAFFLVLDLGPFERTMQALLTPSPSFLLVGAWSVALFCITSLASILILQRFFEGTPRAIGIIFQVIALLAAIWVMIYSGIFLSVYPTIPFLNTYLTPILFVISAVSTGVATLILAGFLRLEADSFIEGVQTLLKFDILLILSEIIVLGLFLYLAYSGTELTQLSVIALTEGEYRELFWLGLVIVGLLVPLVIEIVVLFRSEPSLLAFGSCCTLIGGICLRYAFLLAAVRVNLIDMSVLPYWG